MIILLFLIWRVPLVMREAGGQDEEWFAIPGSTIWQEGIPRVPFVPQRNRESAFYNVDKALFALPPLFYYASAPLYAVLPPTYSTTRLVSITAGVGAIILIFLLANIERPPGGGDRHRTVQPLPASLFSGHDFTPGYAVWHVGAGRAVDDVALV